jgi:hypothetical protein
MNRPPSPTVDISRVLMGPSSAYTAICTKTPRIVESPSRNPTNRFASFSCDENECKNTATDRDGVCAARQQPLARSAALSQRFCETLYPEHGRGARIIRSRGLAGAWGQTLKNRQADGYASLV